MDADAVWHTIDTERAALTRLLAGLTAEQWEQPSLCPGWRVRDVAAHVISTAQVTVPEVLIGFVRARGNLDRLLFEDALRRGRRSPSEILADHRALAGSRRHAPGVSVLDSFVDVIVHIQDITVPLDLPPHPIRPEDAFVGCFHIWSRPLPFRARRRLSGLRLAATDVNWTAGSGAPVHGPIAALLLLLTGRTELALPHLTGTGVPHLHALAQR